MDVDSASSSPSERLSVVCSASAEYSSNSSEGSSPNSRRNSVCESLMKNEEYWEKRRKSNDTSKMLREKRKMTELAMEQRLLILSEENLRLKNRLECHTATDNLLASPPKMADFAALPNQTNTSNSISSKSMFMPPMPATSLQFSSFPSSSFSGISSGVLQSVPLMTNNTQMPILQLCHLQAALQQQQQQQQQQHQHQQYRVQPQSSVFSVGSAFQPFHKESVIMRADRISPDSSSDHRTERVIKRVPSPLPTSDRPQSQSLLGALLSSRRPSPAVLQSRTEQHSGLNSPPRIQMSSSKSDCESISSSASLSPSHSSEENPESLHAQGDGKTVQYMDRRRRNNEAAKRCRANRRAVFEYRSRRVQLLEGENDQLKDEVVRLKNEVEQLKALLASKNSMDMQ